MSGNVHNIVQATQYIGRVRSVEVEHPVLEKLNDSVLGLFCAHCLGSTGPSRTGDNEAKLMTKLAPEWVRTSDPVIRSPARYRWTTAPAYFLR